MDLLIIVISAAIVIIGLVWMNRLITTDYTTDGDSWDEIESAWAQEDE